MFGNRPGQIRCPACHRSTPAGDSCAKCGAAIPPSALSRPRGMDRDELQARIRARRSGQPYRRGGTVPERPAPETWEPEVPAAESDYIMPPPSTQPQQADSRNEGSELRKWVAPVPVVQPPAPPSRGYAAPDVVYGEPDYADPAYQGNAAWSGHDRDIESTDARYELPRRERTERRRAPGAPFLVVGLVVLGAIALLGGAALAGMITRRGDLTGDAVTTPTPVASVGAVATATPGPVATATPVPSETAAPGETPEFSFADGFTAAAEPCLVQPTQPSCPAPGTVVPAGNSTVWILVVFETGVAGDRIAVHGVGPDGAGIGDANWQIPGTPGAPVPGGHAYFGYSIAGFPDGDYEISVTRNGDPAAETAFTIEG